jgi:hypothetical protein
LERERELERKRPKREQACGLQTKRERVLALSYSDWQSDYS